jgi:hypothetical protein
LARTQVTGKEIRDESIQRDDLDVVTTGQAVVRKILAGNNVEIDFTGIDSGTGDVTINVTSTGFVPNPPITAATKTKITYDVKGLVVSGADATTADISASTNRNYVTDAQQVVIGNTSNTNTGDETQSTIKNKLGIASTTSDGYLTSSGYITFNNKQNALTNPITGTGTSGQFAQFNGTTTVTGITENTAFNKNFETVDANIKMNGAAASGFSGNIADAGHIHPTDTNREPLITGGTTSQYWRGDKSFQTLNATAVGLGNVTNDAQLKRAAGDYGAFAIKLTPVDADRILIEDSQDGFIKKAMPMTSLPKNFGTQYINAASLGESSNSTTTYLSKLLMTTPSFPAGTYMISWYAEARSGTSNRFGDLQVLVDGVQIAINTPYITFNDPLISYPCTGIINYTFATVGIKNIELKFRRNPNSSATTWYIRNASLMMFRVS